MHDSVWALFKLIDGDCGSYEDLVIIWKEVPTYEILVKTTGEIHPSYGTNVRDLGYFHCIDKSSGVGRIIVGYFLRKIPFGGCYNGTL